MELQKRVVHGRTIAYRMAGDGPTSVLIHGMGGASVGWGPLLDQLAERGRVVAIDLPGHGGSDKPRGDYSLGSLASTVRDLLVLLEVERGTIIGHSLGGGVAMQFFYQFPERCEGLVLISSGGLGEEVSPLLRALSLPGARHVLGLLCSPRLQGVTQAIDRFFTRIGLRPSPDIAEISRSHATLGDRESRVAFIDTLRAVIDVRGQRVSAADKLSLAAGLPILIVWGDRDPFIPVAHAHAAHAAAPHSRLEIIEGAGHFPHRDDPHRVSSAILAFLDPASERLAEG